MYRARKTADGGISWCTLGCRPGVAFVGTYGGCRVGKCQHGDALRDSLNTDLMFVGRRHLERCTKSASSQVDYNFKIPMAMFRLKN
jgi:hypothetical protein